MDSPNAVLVIALAVVSVVSLAVGPVSVWLVLRHVKHTMVPPGSTVAMLERGQELEAKKHEQRARVAAERFARQSISAEEAAHGS